MKTISKLIITAVLALAAAACTLGVDNTETPESREEITQFKVTTEGTPATKIFVGAGLKLFFNDEDLFTVFNKNYNNKQFRLDSVYGEAMGVLKKVSSGSGSTNPVDHTYAVYPYNSDAQIFNYHDEFYYVKTKLPDVQYYEPNSFGVGANLMLAVTDDDHLEFKNVCGYVRLLLYGDDVSVSQITIKGNNDECIAGQAHISMQNGVPDINSAKLKNLTVSLVCNPSVVLGTKVTSPTAFWFVIPPTNFAQGFKITVTCADGQEIVKTTSEQIMVTRNKYVGMSPVKIEPQTPPTPPDTITLSGKVFLAGDSHVARAASLREQNVPRWGWGEKLPAALAGLDSCALVPQVTNAAQGGRSSEDFRVKYKRWQELIVPYLAENDLVLIEFGPNDLKQNISLARYATNLKWYISQTRAKNAYPVLVTPPNTCTFEADNWTVIASLWSAYSAKMRDVATETNTPLVDVEASSQTWLHNTGYTNALPYYLRSYDPNDLGHLKEGGAELVAGWVAEGLHNLGYWY